MFKVLNRVCDLMSIVGGLLLLFITFSIGYSIFTRKLNLPTPVWVVQFNEYALLWVTFLTTAWILSKDNHVSVQVVVQYFGGKGKRILNMIHAIVGVALCGIFCWYGIYTTRDHFIRGVVDVASVDVPKAYVLLVIPVGFGLLSLQFLRKLILAWNENEQDPRGNHLDNAEKNLGTAEGAEKARVGGKS